MTEIEKLVEWLAETAFNAGYADCASTYDIPRRLTVIEADAENDAAKAALIAALKGAERERDAAVAALKLFRQAKASIAADAYDGVDDIAREMLETADNMAEHALSAATALSQAEGLPNGIGDSVAINRIVEEIRSEHFAEAVEACVKIAEKYVNSTYAKPTRNAGFCAGQIAAEMRALLPTRPHEQERAEPAKHKWVYHGGPGYTQCAHCGVMRAAAVGEDCPPPPPAASFQAGAEAVGEAGSMPGTDGFTMAVFKAADVPIGTKLFTLPIPASSEGR